MGLSYVQYTIPYEKRCFRKCGAWLVSIPSAMALYQNKGRSQQQGFVWAAMPKTACKLYLGLIATARAASSFDDNPKSVLDTISTGSSGKALRPTDSLKPNRVTERQCPGAQPVVRDLCVLQLLASCSFPAMLYLTYWRERCRWWRRSCAWHALEPCGPKRQHTASQVVCINTCKTLQPMQGTC